VLQESIVDAILPLYKKCLPFQNLSGRTLLLVSRGEIGSIMCIFGEIEEYYG
jgi:hypothetical protein